MTRLISYLLLMLGLSLALAWLSSNPGAVTLTWLDWRVDTSAAFLLGMVTLAALVLSGLFILLRTVMKGPRAWQRRIRERSYLLGMQNITESMAALAAGDVAAAHKLVDRAKRYLGDAPIILLLSAQVAKLEGDELATRALMEDMLAHKETRFLAARSLSEYHDRRHQSAQALNHAQEALRLKPRDAAALNAFVSHATVLGRWQEALHAIHKSMLWLPRDKRKRLEGMVYYLRAATLKREGDVASALSFAQHAVKRMPGFAPAAALCVRLTHEVKGTKEALSVLKRLWQQAAHPELAQEFFAATSTMPPEEQLKAARAVSKTLPAHAESQLLLASTAMKAKDWLGARAALMAAVDLNETPRALAMLSEVEKEGFQDLAAAGKWALRARSAGEDATWTCGACSNKEPEWHAHCPCCNAFDRMTWMAPVLRYVSAA